MRVLGIETSCDETAVAIVSEKNGKVEIETSLVASQIEFHKPYGGVVPEVAARRHVDVMFPLLVESGVARDGSDIDAIAVTVGPGLLPALRIGVETAKALAWMWNKPLVAVNHMEGHIYSILGSPSSSFGSGEATFPLVCLLVSGGHTEFLLMRDHGDYERLGQTRDDAAGEAFDKVAKLLGLEYPGGPIISKLAKEGNASAIDFPRPMIDTDTLDMSFSGLKTALRYYCEEHSEADINDICASFQQAVVDVLVAKTLKAVSCYHPSAVILAGGVSANTQLRTTLDTQLAAIGCTLLVPPLSLATDNAAMIALAGLHRAKKQDVVDPLTLCANPNLKLGSFL